MAKSNGIKSLKQAAKLLNKHAPDGEKLAYINKKEAELLRAHGGSGIQTLAGVPSYIDWGEVWDTAKDWGGKAMEFVGWKDDDGKIDLGEIGKDAMSVWTGLKAKKDQEGLNEHEMAQFNKLNQQLADAETEFNINVAGGPSVTNVPTTIEDVASYTDVTLPTMKTTAAAEGGRIGYDKGTHPLDQVALDMFGTTYEELNPLQQIVVNQSKAQGGRIGYGTGSEGVVKKTYDALTQRKIKMLQGMKDSGIEISSEDDKWLQEHTGQAQGGRIGYNFGGIGALDPRMGYQNAGEVENFNWGGPDVVETANMREEALFNNPLFDRDIQALEKEQTGKFEDLVAQEENKKRGDLHNRLQKYQELVNLEDTGGRSIDALIKVAQGHGDNEVVGFLMQFIEETGPISQHKTLPMGAAYGGRIGAQKGGIMPLLDMGGMEKDYRQDGGFVPIGRKEKADDVPARLSKNEFVFTADAVRAAGGGDIDQGAQRMYNVMKNLEAGGEISKQSQGQV